MAAQNNVIGSEELDEFVVKLNVVIDGEKIFMSLKNDVKYFLKN